MNIVLILIIKLFFLINNKILANKNNTIIPKLEYFPPNIFFDKQTNQLLKSKRLLHRLRSIHKNIKKRAYIEAQKQDDPYLNLDRFTKSRIWKFFNYIRLKNKKRKRPRYKAKVINSFAFEKYLILDKNSQLTNSSNNFINEEIDEITNKTIFGINEKNKNKLTLPETFQFDSKINSREYSGIPKIYEPRKPKNLIIALLGVSSDKVYFEAFKYTHYPFISQIKMFGEIFEKETGIIFPHPYYRKFKPLGPISWAYRFSWADFAFGFNTRKMNLNQWMYSVESILLLINYLIEVENYDPKRIFIYGYSQGGGLAFSVALRSKYVLGGMVSTAGFLAERTSKKLLKMEPRITKQGLKIPMLVCHCNPDFIYPYRTSRKDVKFLKQVIKANMKYSLVLGESHSCLSKYSMVYIDWIYSVLSNYKNTKYKPKNFSYKLLDVNSNINDIYNPK